MTDWDDIITLTMQDECWALYLLDVFFVLEAILDEIAGQVAIGVLHDLPQGQEGRHQHQHSWIEETGDVGGSSTQ